MISREEVLQRIYKVAKDSLEKFPENKVLSEDIRLTEDLNLDSLDKVELWLGIEEEFLIEIPEKRVKKFETLKNVVDIIIEYLE